MVGSPPERISRSAPLRRPSRICALTSSRERMVPSCVCASRQNTQRSLQSKVSRTQFRFWCAASSSVTSLRASACAVPPSIRAIILVLPTTWRPGMAAGRRSRCSQGAKRPKRRDMLPAMGETRVLVIHPPVSVARDFIDYPYFADLGAVQLAAVLAGELGEGRVELVDAYALAGARLRWRPDGRALLGVEVDALFAKLEQLDLQTFAMIVVAYTPFHRPPHRDDVLAAVLAGLRQRVGAEPPIVLAD